MLSIPRSSVRYRPAIKEDEDDLRTLIVYFATNYGRCGYRQVTSMIRNAGVEVNHKRVARIWREEGLKVPSKQSKRARIFLSDGSCMRLRAECRHHVWSYDFMYDKTMDGKAIRILNIVDEYSRECLASVCARRFKSRDVLDVLADLMIKHGCPKFIRSDNGPEFVAKELRKWIGDLGVQTAYIEPGSPWENSFVESFNAKMRDGLLNAEVFGNMYEAKALIDRWVRFYNGVRPHSSLRGLPPAPQSYVIPLELKTIDLKRGNWAILKGCKEQKVTSRHGWDYLRMWTKEWGQVKSAYGCSVDSLTLAKDTLSFWRKDMEMDEGAAQ